MKSMTILIIFIFFKFSTLSAPNNIYRAFLVNLHIFLTMQGTCNPAVSNIPTEKQLYRQNVIQNFLCVKEFLLNVLQNSSLLLSFFRSSVLRGTWVRYTLRYT